MRLVGRARDAVTPRSGDAPIICGEGAFEAILKPDRTIVEIASTPRKPALSRLVGQRSGGGLRKVLEAAVPEERQNSSPLYLILDDISGASLVSTWAWSQWNPDWLEVARATIAGGDLAKALAARQGVCIGLAAGSSAFTTDAERGHGTPAPDLRNPEDPFGWHEFTVQNGVGMRRARRIDVRLGEEIVIDSGFQDSATTPAGGRAVVHEYTLRATADARTFRLLSVEATPRILPYRECTSAVPNLKRLLDTPLPELREKVFAELKGTTGCTHLNDVMRALADVPALVVRLSSHLAAE